MTDSTEEKFSLVIGGPFYHLQRRLGLLGPDQLPPLRTAIIFAALAWLPPALLSMAQDTAWDSSIGERAFFLDYGAHARFLVSVFMFVLMERIAEVRIALLVRQFFDSGLVLHEDRHRFIEALRTADRRTSSGLTETILASMAYLASVTAVFFYLGHVQGTWMNDPNGGPYPSLAGWWALLVSMPLFWFLLLRWLWRFIAWAILLHTFSRLNLRLVATHPDRSAGIGFLGLFPTSFAPLIFALSCVSASVALKDIVFAGASLQSMGVLFGVWLVLVAIVFVGPLLVFAPRLSQVRKEALLKYGTLAAHHNRAFEKKWLDGSANFDDAMGTPDISSLSDLGASYDLVRAMGILPAGKETFMMLLLASGLPWLAVLLTQVPLVKVIQALAGALL